MEKTKEKPKRDAVSSDMRARLLSNKNGKLTSDQWKEMVTEPIVTLLLLLVPGIMLLRSTLLAFVVGGLWMVGVAAVVGFAIMLFMRGRRYARLPVHFEVLYGGGEFRPFWMFWRGSVMYTDADKLVRFSRSLAPYFPVQNEQAYLVYYLKDGDRNVLLSAAPADHPDAVHWRPTGAFDERQNRRGRT